ncbi:MAG: putative O-methyltransferase YrrM [Verrucomicrobia bacterium]|nr:MAG: putative O-methyltransferase YrrM [Verrucomicrobiota bacterium]
MNKVIDKIQESGTVTGKSGRIHKLHSPINRQEGLFVYNLIQADASVKKTLEIGCAYGLPSLHICAATNGREDAWHTIIDPLQNTLWDGVGIQNLDAADFDAFELIENKSEFALPLLVQEEEGQFDFVFVEGSQTFDHALLDCFYATRLLRLGGYLVLDSVTRTPARCAADFLNTLPCYEEYASVREPLPKPWPLRLLRLLREPISRLLKEEHLHSVRQQTFLKNKNTRMVAFKKIAEDERGGPAILG